MWYWLEVYALIAAPIFAVAGLVILIFGEPAIAANLHRDIQYPTIGISIAGPQRVS